MRHDHYFRDMAPVTSDAVERALWERDGLPAAWAHFERSYFIACESHRSGMSHLPIPPAILQTERNRKHGNNRPNTGVAWHKPSGKWWAYRPLSTKRRMSLGYFPSKKEAQIAVAKDVNRMASQARLTA